MWLIKVTQKSEGNMTNGDKVRQMTDEEILELMFGDEAFTRCVVLQIPSPDGMGEMLQAVPMIDWMRMEAQ